MIKNNYSGKFIVVEGLDGSGKSAQVDLLVDFLKENGRDVVITKEPTMDSEAGRKIKQALRKEIKVEPLELQKLYVEDRREHLNNKVIPALKDGKCVVSSRYAFSTFAYGSSDGLDINYLIELNKNFLLPDLTIIINTNPESCINRIEGRGEPKELFEQKEKLTKVNDVYKIIPILFKNVVVLDGEKTISEVSEDVRKIVLSQLGSSSMQAEKQDKFTPVFEPLPLTEEDKYLIEPFFTNLDSSVFGVTFLPPEVIGALCSRASRAKDDLRLIFLKEFVKPFIDEGGEYADSLRALIDLLHKYPAELIFSNPKARDFYITWLAQFGDDSIAQMGGTHLIYTGISQLAIKQIEDMRIGIAPIEKSTRYVDYSSKIGDSYRYYTDPTLKDLGLLEEYKSAMDNLFDTYTSLLAEYVEFLKKKYPGEDEKLLRTKAFDTVRLILPVSTLSQLALFSNGQAFEYMVNRCLDNKLGEVRWTARRAVQELSHVIPAFLRRVETEDAENYRRYMSGKGERARHALKETGFMENRVICDGPSAKLLEYDFDGENKIIAGLVYAETHEPFDSLLLKVRKMPTEAKEKILEEALRGRKAKYYKIPRAFENANLSFEIMMNIGAWRDLHRHRMHTQMRQRFSIHNGFDVPAGLKEAGLDSKFISAISKAEHVFRKIAEKDEDLAQYSCTLAHRVRFVQFQNMRSFFWEAELRTIPQGHPDYRKIEQEKIKLVDKIYPLIAKHLLVDMQQYDFARREDAAQIRRKEAELKDYFAKK